MGGPQVLRGFRTAVLRTHAVRRPRRRGRDSNPRYRGYRYNGFRGSPGSGRRAAGTATPGPRGKFAARRGDGSGQPKVSKIETGKQLPTPADVNAWADATHGDAAELLDLLDRARIEYASFRELYVDVAGADQLQDAIGAAEAAATRIAHYDPMLIPASSRPPTTPASCSICHPARRSPAPPTKRSAA